MIGQGFSLFRPATVATCALFPLCGSCLETRFRGWFAGRSVIFEREHKCESACVSGIAHMVSIASAPRSPEINVRHSYSSVGAQMRSVGGNGKSCIQQEQKLWLASPLCCLSVCLSVSFIVFAVFGVLNCESGGTSTYTPYYLRGVESVLCGGGDPHEISIVGSKCWMSCSSLWYSNARCERQLSVKNEFFRGLTRPGEPGTTA